MTARKDQETNFISGIHQYCDRWCERCPATSRCEVFYRENQKRELRLEIGEDPDDWDTILKDVREDFENVIATISEEMKMPAEELKKQAAALTSGSRKQRTGGEISDPLRIDSQRFAMNLHSFLDRLSVALQDERLESKDSEKLLILQEAFEVLSWYHFQIAVKTDRALLSLPAPGKRNRKEAGHRSDADGSAKVAYIGLTRTVDSLVRIHSLLPSYQSEIMPLLEEATRIMERVDRKFPGHRTFVRPGLDD